MKALSFCYVTAQYFPHIGGVERYTYNLSKELIRQGHKVTIVTSSAEGEKDESVQEGIQIIRLPAFQWMQGRYPVVKRNRKFHSMVEKLRNKSFDQVIINTRFYFLSIWGARFAKQQQIPCMVLEHGTAHLKMGGKLTSSLAGIAEHIFAKWIDRYHPVFLGVSEAAGEWLKHFGLESKGTVYNSVDYQEIESYCVLKKDYKESKTVFYAGRLIKEKGILQLIEAVKQLADQMPVTLKIAGSGPLESIVKQAEEPIQYMGSLEMKQVIELMSQSDVFCLPSDSEGFPTAVLEAAACGICVVATTKGGTAEILQNEELGVLLKDNRVETIEKGLYAALCDDESRQRKGKRLHDFVISHFTWTQAAKTIVALSLKSKT